MDLFKAIFAESSSEDDSAGSDIEDNAHRQDTVQAPAPRTSGNTSGVVARERNWQDLSAITSTLLPVGGTSSTHSYGKNPPPSKGTVPSEPREQERCLNSHDNRGWGVTGEREYEGVKHHEVRGSEFVPGRGHYHSNSTDRYSNEGRHCGNEGHPHGGRERHRNEPGASGLPRDGMDKGEERVAGRGVTQPSGISQQAAASLGGGDNLAEIAEGSERNGLAQQAAGRGGDNLAGIAGGSGRSGLTQQVGEDVPTQTQQASYGPALPSGNISAWAGSGGGGRHR